MAIQNKITTLYPVGGAAITDQRIQDHMDEMNALGWELVCIDSLTGWYRLFWKKNVE